ncbi:MAG: hypothetical protein Q4P71_09060 [Actinomycetaceae bacterium]|nr:hypothetical protein [Actinomycetaceae bacterium]
MSTISTSTGCYGPRGWTTARNIKHLLRPFLNRVPCPWLSPDQICSEVLSEYEPFQGLTGNVVNQLLKVLPQANLDDRQNFAPTCQALLQACANNPDVVELIGYAIGPARRDERISIEGLIYYADTPRELHDGSAKPEELWQQFKSELNLHNARLNPDELRRVTPTWSQHRRGWLLWWD